MDPVIKEEWIAALESGEYTRGEKRLKVEGDGKVTHCCLGVLCELHHAKTGEGKWSKVINFEYGISPMDANDKVLPASVNRWCGLGRPGVSPGVFYPDQEDTQDIEKHTKVPLPIDDNGKKYIYLTQINDYSSRKDFSEVIPYIKKYF